MPYKSSSERMAAKALTELSDFSKKDTYATKTKKKNIKAPYGVKNIFKETLKHVDTNKIEESDEKHSLQPEINMSLYVTDADKNLCLQQKLETAAVLMDISKKVIISPPCSNPQSPSICASIDSSILNSVIKNKRPLNDKPISEMGLSTKNNRCDLQNLIDFPVYQNRSVYAQDINLENSVASIKNNQLSALTAIKNARVIHSELEHSSNSNRIEIDSTAVCERKSPDSITSEEHGTDAATTQLWQALARSAGKHYLFQLFQNIFFF